MPAWKTDAKTNKQENSKMIRGPKSVNFEKDGKLAWPFSIKQT